MSGKSRPTRYRDGLNVIYFGRVEANVTSFVAYFCLGTADAFAAVRSRAGAASRISVQDHSPILRDLSPQQRQVLGLFLRMNQVTGTDLATFFTLPARQAYLLCQPWLLAEVIVVGNPSAKSRRYRLAPKYEALVAIQ